MSLLLANLSAGRKKQVETVARILRQLSAGKGEFYFTDESPRSRSEEIRKCARHEVNANIFPNDD